MNEASLQNLEAQNPSDSDTRACLLVQLHSVQNMRNEIRK